MKNNNQKIGCSVESCRHCNCDKHECLLDAIKVVNNGISADCKEDAICDSFDRRED